MEPIETHGIDAKVAKVATVATVATVAKELRASMVTGSYVYNSAAENIGLIDDLMIGDGNRVHHAILSIGGFLGLGSHLVAVPFGSLAFGDDRIYLPGATREQLKRLPEFDYP